MTQPSPVLFIILALMTLIVLLVGITLMAKGGKVNQEYSNKLMVARVVLQALALTALALLYFFH